MNNETFVIPFDWLGLVINLHIPLYANELLKIETTWPKVDQVCLEPKETLILLCKMQRSAKCTNNAVCMFCTFLAVVIITWILLFNP